MNVPRTLAWFFLGFGLVILFAAVGHPHGGGLDGYGCHHNRKAGGYHCHRGPLAGQSFGSKDEMLKELKQSKTAEPTEKKSKDSR
jgi:hypothetical protein